MYSIDELNEIKNMDLSSQEDRQEVGTKLIETIKSGGEESIKAVEIIIENKLSYYIIENEESILNTVKGISDPSILFVFIQLYDYIYDNHGITDYMPESLLQLLEIDEKYTNKENGYETTLHRFNTTRDPEEISKSEFNDEFTTDDEGGSNINAKNGKRVIFKNSNSTAILTETNRYIEFEFYERVERKILDKGTEGTKYIQKIIKNVAEVFQKICVDEGKVPDSFGEIFNRLISICSQYTGEITEYIFDVLPQIYTSSSSDRRETIEETIIKGINTQFSYNPIDDLISIVLAAKGDVQMKTEIQNHIDKEYNLINRSGSKFYFSSNEDIRNATVAVGYLTNCSSWRIIMAQNGFIGYIPYIQS